MGTIIILLLLSNSLISLSSSSIVTWEQRLAYPASVSDSKNYLGVGAPQSQCYSQLSLEPSLGPQEVIPLAARRLTVRQPTVQGCVGCILHVTISVYMQTHNINIHKYTYPRICLHWL